MLQSPVLRIALRESYLQRPFEERRAKEYIISELEVPVLISLAGVTHLSVLAAGCSLSSARTDCPLRSGIISRGLRGKPTGQMFCLPPPHASVPDNDLFKGSRSRLIDMKLFLYYENFRRIFFHHFVSNHRN